MEQDIVPTLHCFFGRLVLCASKRRKSMEYITEHLYMLPKQMFVILLPHASNQHNPKRAKNDPLIKIRRPIMKHSMKDTYSQGQLSP